ncbi:MAG: hypothetical protein ABL864_04105 [Terricaulis sp.]
MNTNEAVDAALATLQQTYVQILVGGTAALLLRGIARRLLIVAALLSSRATQVRLKHLNEELMRYQFFQSRPAALAARSVELQLWAALFTFLFFDVYAFASTITTQMPAALPVIAVIQATLSAAVAWILSDLFSLVGPQVRFEEYESAVRERITRMREALSRRREKLRTQLGDLEQPWEQVDALERLQADGVGSATGPRVGVRETYEPTGGAPQPKQYGTDTSAETTHATPDPSEQFGAAEDSTAQPRDSTAEPTSGFRGHHAGQSSDSSVYQTSWISGSIKRWPEWGTYGFIRSDTGEEFYVDSECLAGLEPQVEGQVVLFQAAPGTPNRRAALVCGLGSYAQGRVNGIRGNMGFITIFDSRRSASIYFRLPAGALPDFNVGDTVGFRFGRNIIGPTAERIDTDLGRKPRRSQQGQS